MPGELDAVFDRFAHDKENLPEMPEIRLVVRRRDRVVSLTRDCDDGAPGLPG